MPGIKTGGTSAFLSNVFFPVRFAVVIGDFFPGQNFPLGVDKHPFAVKFCIAVRFAGMIDVTRRIFTDGSVDIRIIFQFKNVLAAFFVRGLVINTRAPVFQDKIAALNGAAGKESKAGQASFYDKLVARRPRVCVTHRGISYAGGGICPPVVACDKKEET